MPCCFFAAGFLFTVNYASHRDFVNFPYETKDHNNCIASLEFCFFSK
jgi:hypothetical protein